MNDEERVGKVQLCLSHRLGNLGFTYYSLKILCYLDHCEALQSAWGVIILNGQIQGFHLHNKGNWLPHLLPWKQMDKHTCR